MKGFKFHWEDSMFNLKVPRAMDKSGDTGVEKLKKARI
jgi:hypothetical protein